MKYILFFMLQQKAEKSPYEADVPVAIISLPQTLPAISICKKYDLIYDPKDRYPVVKVYVIEDDVVKGTDCSIKK